MTPSCLCSLGGKDFLAILSKSSVGSGSVCPISEYLLVMSANLEFPFVFKKHSRVRNPWLPSRGIHLVELHQRLWAMVQWTFLVCLRTMVDLEAGILHCPQLTKQIVPWRDWNTTGGHSLEGVFLGCTCMLPVWTQPEEVWNDESEYGGTNRWSQCPAAEQIIFVYFGSDKCLARCESGLTLVEYGLALWCTKINQTFQRPGWAHGD